MQQQEEEMKNVEEIKSEEEKEVYLFLLIHGIGSNIAS